ncbi:carboxymuconolactone decarboxylase family protein [Paenirhodobacter sp.]|uniref:carboxymuconolactone decarboxylase family protein n=1 Tax=Paenirhodobacter sp. TaxID=1965326 RepID=UPI003B3F6C43
MTEHETTAPFSYQKSIPDVLEAFLKVHGAIDAHGLERRLYHLILLRASQINECAHCIKLHVREALEDGETHDRLHRLVVWRDVSDFTPRERAALAWTEALTRLEHGADYGPLRAELRAHFTDEEIGAVTANITMINVWNRIRISAH